MRSRAGLRFAMVLAIVVTVSAIVVLVGTRGSAGGAHITVFTGSATLVREGQAQVAHSGDVAHDGDVVATGPDGRAALTFGDGSTTRLDVGSRITVHLQAGVRLEQASGLTWNRVLSPAGGNGFRVEGPNATSAVVRGTLFGYYIEHDPTGAPVVWVDAWEGSVEVSTGVGSTVLASSGQRVTVRSDARPAPPVAIPAGDRQLSFTVFNRALDASAGTVVALREQALNSGAAAEAVSVQVQGDDPLNWVLAWPGSSYRVEVIDPSGARTQGAPSTVSPLGGRVTHPASGPWRFVVYDVESPPGELSWLAVTRGG